MKHVEITFSDPQGQLVPPQPLSSNHEKSVLTWAMWGAGRERFIVALKEANSNTRSPSLTTRTNSKSQSSFTMAGVSPTLPSGLLRVETSSGPGLEFASINQDRASAWLATPRYSLQCDGMSYKCYQTRITLIMHAFVSPESACREMVLSL